MVVLQTERLILRRFELRDAAFILRLVNEPAWLEFIGDKGVRTLADAAEYLRKGPLDMYQRYGFGLYRVELAQDGTPIGTCGLIKRDTLPDVDIGYALLPEFWGRGYAREAAAAVLSYGARAVGLARIVAITTPHNASSIRLLEKIGLKFERALDFGSGDQVKLFARNFDAARGVLEAGPA